MLNSETLTVIITGISGVVTACIPLAARFSASRSEAVKTAGIARSEDVELLKALLQKCINEKAELRKLITEVKQ